MEKEAGGPVAQDELEAVIRYYDLWRRIADLVGDGSYDPADWKDDHLYLRSDYSEKSEQWPEWAVYGEWAAWIIAPNRGGYVGVLSSLKHERQAERTQRIEVMFSRFLDAGKYVILQIGDSIRSRREIRLKTLIVKWEERGLDKRIRVEQARPEAINFFTSERPTLDKDYAKNHLKAYTLDYDPGSYGYALDSEHPTMEVLALSFEELTDALLDGMPDSITSQVARWRD